MSAILCSSTSMYVGTRPMLDRYERETSGLRCFVIDTIALIPAAHTLRVAPRILSRACAQAAVEHLFCGCEAKQMVCDQVESTNRLTISVRKYTIAFVPLSMFCRGVSALMQRRENRRWYAATPCW